VKISIEEVLSFKGVEVVTKRKRILRSEQDCGGVKLDVFPFHKIALTP
jgi:hypothetical protein